MIIQRAAIALALPIAIIGCAPQQSLETPTIAECNAEKVQALIGREATDAVGAMAVKRAGARVLRKFSPGDAVTMDYRSDRLNIAVDAANKIVSINCA